MNCVILTQTFAPPPICEKEILRYAGCVNDHEETRQLLSECLKEVGNKLTYKVCYRELPLKINKTFCDFGFFGVDSKKLATNLEGCKSVVVFAATLGVEIDRMITKYGHLSPAKALIFQAIGAERIEALCNDFCAFLKKEYGLNPKPRFSAGYGDLPLTVQKDLFNLLEPHKRIGLTLNNSLIMSPTKSVTAFVGLGGSGKNFSNKCNNCDNKNCSFRGV